MKKAKSTKSPANSHSTKEGIVIVHELLAIKDSLGRLGLWKGHHALDEAINTIGWEIAGHED